jgi:hypothetical protein
MFTNNKFAKMDSIANLVKNILEADTKAKMEELKGNQHKIDKNKNNKIDAHDFAILRGQKKGMKEEAEQVDEARVKGKGYDNPENERKAPEGHVSMTSLMPGHDERAAKFLARQAKGKLVKGKAQSAPQKEEIDPNKTTTDTLKGREKTSSNPFLSKKVMMDVPDNVKEEVEQVDERTLTKPETAEKERIVKGMKKSLAGFKSRYGEKAKSVMYATATARAKEKK